MIGHSHNHDRGSCKHEFCHDCANGLALCINLLQPGESSPNPKSIP